MKPSNLDAPDEKSIHQMQVVQKACKTIQMEIPFTQEQINCVGKYFHFLYSIGYFKGSRQLSHNKRVISTNTKLEVLRTFESAIEAAGVLGVSKSNIGRACEGKFKCRGLTLMWEKDFLKIS